VVTNKGWNDRTVLQRNAYAGAGKLYKADFSILGKADVIKNDPRDKDPFYYRLDANQLGRWGGVWQAPSHYTFTGTFGNLTGVSLIKRFDNWTSGPFAISNRMPWLPKLDDLALLTTNDRLIQEIPWGTIVTRHKWPFDPSPWIYGNMPFPGRIWYWMKEQKKGTMHVKRKWYINSNFRSFAKKVRTNRISASFEGLTEVRSFSNFIFSRIWWTNLSSPFYRVVFLDQNFAVSTHM